MGLFNPSVIQSLFSVFCYPQVPLFAGLGVLIAKIIRKKIMIYSREKYVPTSLGYQNNYNI